MDLSPAAQALVSGYNTFFQGNFGAMAPSGLPVDIQTITATLKAASESEAVSQLVATADIDLAHRSINVLSNIYLNLVKTLSPVMTHNKALQALTNRMTLVCKTSVGINVIGIALITIGTIGMMYNSGNAVAGRRRLFYFIAIGGTALIAYSTLGIASIPNSKEFLVCKEISQLLSQNA